MPSRISRPVLVSTLVVIALASPALTRADADPEQGRKLAYTCYGCHGIPNYKNVYPTYSVPKLEGQHAEYLALALQGYRSGDRSHATMHSQAATMSDQDMQDIAAFLAGNRCRRVRRQSARRRRRRRSFVSPVTAPRESASPRNTHRLRVSTRTIWSGTLKDYRDGGRKNPVMSGFVSQLTDEDIKELAEYYSQQRPSLSTAKHATWFAQEGHDTKGK